LIRAAGRGVRVRIYMDGRRIGEREPAPLFRELLANPEIEVRFKRPGSPLMHLRAIKSTADGYARVPRIFLRRD